MSLVAVLLVAVSLLSPRTDTHPYVTTLEFRQVSVGDGETHVEKAWDTPGTFKHLVIDGDQVSKVVRYRSAWGQGTWVLATYRLGSQARRWWLTEKEWCNVNDMSTGSTCKHHPWP